MNRRKGIAGLTAMFGGYYESEVGMTVEKKYLPVPGRYDGAHPYEKVGTLFTE